MLRRLLPQLSDMTDSTGARFAAGGGGRAPRAPHSVGRGPAACGRSWCRAARLFPPVPRGCWRGRAAEWRV